MTWLYPVALSASVGTYDAVSGAVESAGTSLFTEGVSMFTTLPPAGIILFGAFILLKYGKRIIKAITG